MVSEYLACTDMTSANKETKISGHDLGVWRRVVIGQVAWDSGVDSHSRRVTIDLAGAALRSARAGALLLTF